MRTSTFLTTLTALLPTTLAAVKGFNYGSTFTDGTYKQLADYTNDFNSAKNLAGTSGFTSARLYTMIQGGSTNTPISAIQAAINTKTTLLLGLWASGGDAGFANEIQALKNAVGQYGTAFTDLVIGVSIGSEDLYRLTDISVENDGGVGASPATIVNYISQTRAALAGTAGSALLIGHVDTWTAWVNASNSAVISACDFIGMDAYPYYENTKPNGIENANATFWDAFDNTKAAVGGKPIWVTETGWPTIGATDGQAVASVANAETYWSEVGCSLFGAHNTWWFTLQDTQPTTGAISFGVVGAGNPPPTTPLYALGC